MYEVDPKLIWWNGAVVPWQDAQVHVTSETALRGLNVFEGIRGYWRPGQCCHAVVSLTAHLERLGDSARLLHIPHDGLIPMMRQGISELLDALSPCGDVYLRPTLYLETGRYSSARDTVSTGAFIACHATDPTSDHSMTCVVSSYQRIPEAALSTLAKNGAAYTAFRLARLEALRAGADEAILLNARGTVAETAGASVFAVRRGRLVTPPLADGVLDSLTRATVIKLAWAVLSLTVEERSLSRSEIYTADEVFVTGTLDEVRLVASIDGHVPRDRAAPVGSALRSAYRAMCVGQRPPLDAAFVELLP
ncbi:MAG: aminotransferase class IV [Pseudonocardiaceae bacterium]